jgi:hypothetical protein
MAENTIIKERVHKNSSDLYRSLKQTIQDLDK